MSKDTAHFSKYLHQYAEPEAIFVAEHLSDKYWQFCLSIPCYNELENLPSLIERIAHINKKKEVNLLLILNVNNMIQCDTHARKANDLSIKFILQHCHLQKQFSDNTIHAYLLEFKGLEILLLDKSTNLFALPNKTGVGLARKISADIAAALYWKNNLKSPFLFNTDADACIAEDYFDHIESFCTKKMSALLFPFIHTIPIDTDQFESLAAKIYHDYLHYYVAGLKFANSPYAYHTIGSTIGLNLEKYILVRGFPKREAGEDFYLLNKLAKVGTIVEKSSQPIQLQSRLSQRVPFGTGQSILQIAQKLRNHEPYLVYDPKCFLILKIYLETIVQNIKNNNLVINLDILSNIKISNSIDADLESFFYSFHYFDKYKIHFMSSPHEAQRLKNFHDWFDSFQTLKFIHQVRDFLFPTKNYQIMYQNNLFH